ncbi:hypothetical protein Fot_42200 [Forsythia ovata]|uniref:Uncharacterized protein n=1 Tax=Forsythia ovata TaxID=205694 RepID=A0ABD1RKJ6_9LAMI
MSSTNTMLGSENEALWSKVETLMANKCTLKEKLQAATEEVRKAYSRATAAETEKYEVVAARRMATTVENNVVVVNHDYDVMVTEKKRWLVEATNELEKARKELVAVKTMKA